MKRKLTICPFTKREYALINYLSDSFSIQHVLSPKGIGIEHDDIAYLRFVPNTGITFCNSIESGVKDSDVVLISDIDVTQDKLYGFAKEAMRYAAMEKKDIISFLSIDKKEQMEIRELCAKHGTTYNSYESHLMAHSNLSSIGRLEKFDVPILYIAELFPGCESYDLFLSICCYLRRQGYNILGISEDIYNSLFNLSYFKFNSDLNPAELIFRINNAIHKMEKALHPDLIVIRFPHPVMKYNEETPFDCGASAYIISQAAPGDAGIITVPSGFSSPQFWDQFTESYHTKFGYPIIGVQVSNQICDSVAGLPATLIHISLDGVIKQNHLMNQRFQVPFFNIYEDDLKKSLFDKIISEYIQMPYGVIN